MALSADGLASKLMTDLKEINDPTKAINAFWKSVCDYFKVNAVVTYAWAGVNASGTPDPVVVMTGTLETGGTLSLCNLSDPDDALAAMSTQMNTAAATWTVKPQTGFTLATMLVLPTISLGKSGKDNQSDAIKAVATDIINGIKAATASSVGSHAAYSGTATFTSIT